MAFFNTSCLCPIYFSDGPLFTHQYIEVQDTNQVLQQEKNMENSKDKGNTKLKAWQCDTSGILFHNLKSVCNVYVKIIDGYNSYKYKGLYMEYSHHSTCIRLQWSTASPGHSWICRDPAQCLRFLRLWIGMGWGFFIWDPLADLRSFYPKFRLFQWKFSLRVNFKIKQILDMFIMPYSKDLSPNLKHRF